MSLQSRDHLSSAAMADLRSFNIVELPKPPRDAEMNPQWSHLAEKFRDLRLRSLQIAPEAFASTYEAESRRGLDQTFDRLQNAKARQFIALEGVQANERSSLGKIDIDDLHEREWVGMIVLLGPMEAAVTARADPVEKLSGGQYGDESFSGPTREDHSAPSEEFVLNGVFVAPSYRGMGVGKALVDTALARAKSLKSIGRAGNFVTVLVNKENMDARLLYEKCGFDVVGAETYARTASLGEAEAVEKLALKMRLSLTSLSSHSLRLT